MNGSEMLANLTSAVNSTVGNTTEIMVPAPTPRIGSSARSDLAFYYQCVLVPIGIITNIVNLIYLRKFRKGAMNVYLTTLSAIDLIFSLNLAVTTYYRTLQYTESYWFAMIYSKTVIPINSIFGHLSVWMAVIIAADRTVHVTLPMKAKVWVTTFRAKIVVGVTLTILIILRSPIFLYFTAKSGILPSGLEVYWASWDPFFFTSLGQALFITQAALFEFIPSSLLVVLNVIIIIFFRRYRQKRVKMMEGKSKDKANEVMVEYKLTITLSILMLSAVIGNFPVNLVRLIFANPREGVIYKDISSFFFILDHTTNFLIYFVSNSDFRSIILGLFPKCGRSSSPSPGVPISSDGESTAVSTVETSTGI